MANQTRIYIVEDERIIAIDLQRRLERLGYQVCGSAASGEQALEGIRKTLPDLALMDIVIQGNIDGIEVAVQIRQERNIPVIFLSAYTDTATLERAKEASPLGYILKPFKERELATILEMALYKSVADNRIREKEQMFSAILNSTTDAIIVADRQKRILFLNPEAEQILDITDAESKGRMIPDLFTLSDMETGKPFTESEVFGTMKLIKAHNLRLTNHKQNSFVVDLTVNTELADSGSENNYIVSFKDISRLHEITDTLKYQSSHDTLTGLLNRNELALRLNAVLTRTVPSAAASALFVDIDHFKIINDSCGTQAGDRLLKQIAEQLKGHLAGTDFAARSGGDDFVLVHFSPDPAANDAETREIGTKILEFTHGNPFCWGDKEYPITVSVAQVTLNSTFKNEHEIMIAGTQTVHNTHESGGNRFSAYSESENLRHPSVSISEWISRIHQALVGNQFRLYYQPIQPLAPGNAKSKLEILLRMVTDDGTVIMPGEFIPIAERYNIMATIDRWVVQKSMEALARLRSEAHPLGNDIFCINLSGASLADDSIISLILDTADSCGIPPGQICIEVTETNAILNLTSASRFIYILKERGFTFALDDFGSGFSSFNYLKNLPVDYLKIDGSFIRNMDRDKVDCTMVQAITSMCRVLGLQTIGEFAENETIIGMLRDIGVDYAQGYGIAKPAPLPGSKADAQG